VDDTGVGIGTDSPQTLLHVSSATGSDTITPTAIRVQSTTSAGNFDTTTPWGELQFFSSDASGIGSAVRAKIGAQMETTIGSLASMVFYTADGSAIHERLRITSAGNVGIAKTPTGGIKLDVSGEIRASTGILFGTDTAAANTLSDYEEGTWTIGISFGGASDGVTTLNNTGTFTKIGRTISVNGFLRLSSKGTSTGNALITGLPVAIASGVSNFATASLRLVNVSFANQFQAFGNEDTSTIVLNEITEAGTFSTLTDANFDNDSTLVISLTYFTS
jgi:hypothetical protein